MILLLVTIALIIAPLGNCSDEKICSDVCNYWSPTAISQAIHLDIIKDDITKTHSQVIDLTEKMKRIVEEKRKKINSKDKEGIKKLDEQVKELLSFFSILKSKATSSGNDLESIGTNLTEEEQKEKIKHARYLEINHATRYVEINKDSVIHDQKIDINNQLSGVTVKADLDTTAQKVNNVRFKRRNNEDVNSEDKREDSPERNVQKNEANRRVRLKKSVHFPSQVNQEK